MVRTMRVVYLHQYFVTRHMPGGVRSYEMARRLVREGHEVHMVTSDQAGDRSAGAWRQSQESGITVHWTPVPYDNSMSYARRIGAFMTFAVRAARRAAQLHPDVVFATSTPLTIAIPAVYAAWRSHSPMVFEVRDLWPAVPIAMGVIRNPFARRAATWLERFAYRNATRIVALAPGMRDEISATGYPPDRISVIPNGCDLDAFADVDGARQLRQQHNWLGSRPLLVYCGAFGAVNGMEYLVRLAAAIASIDPEIRIAAIGSGREFERTERLASEQGVLGRSLFLLGKVPKSEADAWTLASDMTIALITGPRIVWRDAVQNKFFDSLAAGKPVASNFAGWQSEIAVDEGAGLILSATDVVGAAGDVVKALRDRAWLERAGRAARTLAEGRFNRDVLAADLERVLRDACVNP
jgi:glycosyltransferase involved in cell wall biosynthesis